VLRPANRKDKLATLIGSALWLFDFDGVGSGRMQPQIGQVGFGEPHPNLLHTANDLGQRNSMRKQLGNLPGARKITKSEQAAPRVQQAEPDKLVDGAIGELAQARDLIGRIGPVQTIRDRLPDPLQKAPLAYHRNAVAARFAQLVRWPAIIHQRPAEFAHNEQIGPAGDFLAWRSAIAANCLERFGPAHAGETARKRDVASER
jgi:hypothetical protein